MTNIDHYTYRVTSAAAEGEFVGLVAEFPSLSWLDGDQLGVLRGIRNLVASVVADMEALSESVPHPHPHPHPLSERRYSRVVKLCIPPELHCAPAIKAAEENVSLNRLVNSWLA